MPERSPMSEGRRIKVVSNRTQKQRPPMSDIPDTRHDVPALLEAALLLAAREPLRRHGLTAHTAASILKATGAGRTRAYKLAAELMALLPTLARPVGRPRKEPDQGQETADPATPSLQDHVIDYLLTNPGSAKKNIRGKYTQAFRRFILDLREAYPSMPIQQFASAVHVPLKTVQEWIRDQRDAERELKADARDNRDDKKTPSSKKPSGDAQDGETPAVDSASEYRIQTVLTEHRSWKGDFVEFCQHIRKNCHINYGRTMISEILSSHGLRSPKKRRGRSPDERALRKAFETFFPGAQWVGDGHEITFKLNGETFKFNLELFVDADTAALVGAHVGEQEDSSAVIRAFGDGVATTGNKPLAALLDNRASNHTDDVREALEDTLLIRSTPGRAQNKGHVEGAFGLFQQTVPSLEINASNLHDLVAAIVTLIFQTWARTINHRKRRKRGDRSRVDLYQNGKPSPEDIKKARAKLIERQKRQEKARATELARQNPVVRKLLVRAFEEFGLVDPDGNVKFAIARYSLETIVDGIATFRAKKSANTLPATAGASYLLGIVRNINARAEIIAMVDELLQLRLEARDIFLAHLVTEREVLQKAEPDTRGRLDLFIERALDTDNLLTRLFWLRSTANQIRAAPQAQHDALVRRAAGHIATNYRVPVTVRQEAVRYLAGLVVPLR